MKMKINTGLLYFYIFVSAASFIFAISTMWQFVEFLSALNPPYQYNNNSEEQSVFTSIKLLGCDLLLLTSFIFIHSGLTERNMKKLFSKYQIEVIQRSVYVTITCSSVQLIMYCWQHLMNFQLWALNTKNSNTWWWIFMSVHISAWICIYGGCILYDFAELMGIKQVYYFCRGFDDPIHFKSLELQRMYSHMRHPSFLAFCCIFWFYPIMTLDRFILAVVLTLYMCFQFKVDNYDYLYQRQQFGRKYYEEAIVFTTHYSNH